MNKIQKIFIKMYKIKKKYKNIQKTLKIYCIFDDAVV